MYCKYCGKPIETDSIFCCHCGRKLTDEAVKETPRYMSTAAKEARTVIRDGETYTIRNGIVFDEEGFDVCHEDSTWQ